MTSGLRLAAGKKKKKKKLRNCSCIHRCHPVRDQPGPKLPASDHRPAGAGGRVAVPPAGRVPDGQLQRGPASLLSDRPPRLNLKKKNVPGPRRTAAKTQSEARIVLWHSGGRSEGDLLESRSAPQADKSPPLHGFPPASVLPQCTLPGSCLNSSTEKLCCGRKKAQLRLNFSCFVVVYSAKMDAPWSMMWLFEDCMCTWTFNGTSCAGRTCFISGF